MFVANSRLSEDLPKIVDCFRAVAEQNGDGSEYSYERFLAKGIGVDSDDRWRIVLLECEWGLPESEYLYGKHLYSRGRSSLERAAFIGPAPSQSRGSISERIDRR